MSGPPRISSVSSATIWSRAERRSAREDAKFSLNAVEVPSILLSLALDGTIMNPLFGIRKEILYSPAQGVPAQADDLVTVFSDQLADLWPSKLTREAKSISFRNRLFRIPHYMLDPVMAFRRGTVVVTPTPAALSVAYDLSFHRAVIVGFGLALCVLLDAVVVGQLSAVEEVEWFLSWAFVVAWNYWFPGFLFRRFVNSCLKEWEARASQR